MLFNSFSFALFLPIVFMIYWGIPKKYQWIILFVSSYYFYMSWNIKYVLLILFTTVVSYTAAIIIEQESCHCKKAVLTTALLASLWVLFFFKYFNFCSTTIAEMLNLFSWKTDPVLIDILLPVGISFYTFQTLSYVIDVYRGTSRAEHHFGKYAAFISFFPQLVAGPIERTNNLLPQIKARHTFNYEQAVYGLRLMAWGYFKKMVIADTLAIYVDRIYDNVTAYSGLSLVAATFFFAIQIYCDFSGYSDIAIGTSKLFGINLMKNFQSPYFAKSVKEFWGRWHISLSTWFRDYVYIPLGGNRVSRFRHKLNLVLTFMISGLWHGANWTFAAWGSIHGIAQAAESMLPTHKPDKSRAAMLISSILVFIFVSAAWIFFRAQSLSDAWYVLSHSLSGISSPIQYIKTGYYDLGIGRINTLCCTFQIFLLCMYDYISQRKDIITCIGHFKKPVRWLIYMLIILMIIFWSPIVNETEFIYFQF